MSVEALDPVGQVLVGVAKKMGQAVSAVMREPYALTLWTWWLLQEQEDRERLRLEHARIDAAGLQAIAFHDPKQLAKVEERFLHRVRESSEHPERRREWKETAKERLRRLQVLRPISPEEAGVIDS